MNDQHGGAPFMAQTIHIETGDGTVVVDYLSDQAAHRHFTMMFQRGENEAVDDLIRGLMNALVAQAQRSMLDMVGDVLAPEDLGGILPKWQCRICDMVADAGTIGWAQVERAPTFPGGDPVLVRYCPEHAPTHA